MSEICSQEIQEQLQLLAPDQQRQVLAFMQSLNAEDSIGNTGHNLAKIAGTISQNDLDIMSTEIEAGCEQVQLDEW